MTLEIRPPAPDDAYHPLERMDVEDMEQLRLLLRGGSVIDWMRLGFKGAGEVEDFLRLNLYDLEDPRDVRRLRAILGQAVEYLRAAFGYMVATPVAAPDDLRTLFLLASGVAEPHKYRRIACVVLKVMHIIHHLEARELLFRTALREADLAARIHRRVLAEAGRMKARGLPLLEFAGSTKTRASLVTKLLAKKESLAAQVFDRVRFRIVTERRDQIAPVLHYLAQHLFPFNYAVPGQTQNNLIHFQDLLAEHPRGPEIAAGMQLPPDLERRDGGGTRNAFSGKEYRALNFVVDIPIRIDELIAPGDPVIDELGRVVFSLVEFQIFDRETAGHNEEGDSSHDRYKRRQHQEVLRRLSRGLVVPRRSKRGEP